MRKHELRRIGTFSLVCSLLAGAGIWAQLPQRDPLAGLKRALSEAGAPALTSEQDAQLRSLITTFRDAQRSSLTQAGGSLQSARRAYDDAILAGDLSAAQARAAAIATQMSNGASQRLQAEANFKIQALNVLKTNANQVGLLLQRLGTGGLSRLLGSLGGGPRFGPGPGGPALNRMGP
ncbi:MAG: hypothetical protein HY652_09870 [Acidobacteria bacterium]|nr:hypothetical protein [Acidobacteriota bacterium]